MANIILVGGPETGFTAVGPLDKPDDDGAIGEWARVKYGGANWYELPLYGPSDPGGGVIVCGSISRPFEFHGPFIDVPTAEKWARRMGGGLINLVFLKPVNREELAA
jgi:hypothetical protein